MEELVLELSHYPNSFWIGCTLGLVYGCYHTWQSHPDQTNLHCDSCIQCNEMNRALCEATTRITISFWKWQLYTEKRIYTSMRTERQMMCVRISLRHFLTYRMFALTQLIDLVDLQYVLAKLLLQLMDVIDSWGEPMNQIHSWNQVFQL